MKERTSQKKIDKINELHDKGYTYQEINKKTGVCMGIIYRTLNKRVKEERKIRDEKIIALRKENLPQQEIADIVGCHRCTVYTVLKKQEDYVKNKRVGKKMASNMPATN